MTNFTAIEHTHMALALALAERGLFTTRPNPRVGCVLAHGATVVGTGWHQKAGTAHAEVHALAAAGLNARGATAYVTLEPCAHFGRTPPCADALIAAGVARVVTACVDPFPQVAGLGLARLAAAGIASDFGLMYEQARVLNAGFFSRIERARPWLRLKLAMSVDGRTAPIADTVHTRADQTQAVQTSAERARRWLTGPAAQRDVHRLRARACAVLTGIDTVLADDPGLDVRLDPADLPGMSELSLARDLSAVSLARDLSAVSLARDLSVPAPLKIVLDRQLRTPASAKLFGTPGAVLIAHSPTAPEPQRARLRAAGAELFQLPAAEPEQLLALFAELGKREINEVHTEAGATLCGALLHAGLVDELVLYQAPILLGDQAQPLFALPGLSMLHDRIQLELLEQRVFGPDLRFRYRCINSV